MSKILHNLFLGSIKNANSKTVHYDVIINLSCERLDRDILNKSIVYNFDIDDIDTAPIYLFFNRINRLIDHHRSLNHKILVNCYMGISRSSTIVISYLMDKYGLSYYKAYSHVLKKRPIINPNKGFIQQLKKYYK